MANQCKGTTLSGKRCKRRFNTKIYCHSHENQKPYNDECPVCMKDGDMILKCKHSICEKCYHSTIKIKTACPVCRAKIDVDESHCIVCFMTVVLEQLNIETEIRSVRIYIVIKRGEKQ